MRRPVPNRLHQLRIVQRHRRCRSRPVLESGRTELIHLPCRTDIRLLQRHRLNERLFINTFRRCGLLRSTSNQSRLRGQKSGSWFVQSLWSVLKLWYRCRSDSDYKLRPVRIRLGVLFRNLLLRSWKQRQRTLCHFPNWCTELGRRLLLVRLSRRRLRQRLCDFFVDVWLRWRSLGRRWLARL